MKPVNLYILSRIKDFELFVQFDNIFSNRTNVLNKPHEKESLDDLVDLIIEKENNNSINLLDSFYYSYDINSLDMEFDLLRISSKYIINIDLKNYKLDKKTQTEREKEIKDKLYNQYRYLHHLSFNSEIHSFTYDNYTNSLYYMFNGFSFKKLFTMRDKQEIPNIEVLVKILKRQNNDEIYIDNIEDLFLPSKYLTSPLNAPASFLLKYYILNQQQQQIKSEIMKYLDEAGGIFIGIKGRAGTGKSLLLYDIAMDMINNYNKKCCVVHCGILCDGHKFINNNKNINLEIVEAKTIGKFDVFDTEEFDVVMIDEAQRIDPQSFDRIVELTRQNKWKTLFFYDETQTYSQKEMDYKNEEKIKQLLNYDLKKLSNKIRTNKNILNFLEHLKNLESSQQIMDISSIKILFTQNHNECEVLIKYFQANGYIFINFTEKFANSNNITNFDDYVDIRDTNTHMAIGQEFEKVIMVMDDTFYYANNKLQAKPYPNSNYLYIKLLEQGITRAIDKLILIIVGDEKLFQQILAIVETQQKSKYEIKLDKIKRIINQKEKPDDILKKIESILDKI